MEIRDWRFSNLQSLLKKDNRFLYNSLEGLLFYHSQIECSEKTGSSQIAFLPFAAKKRVPKSRLRNPPLVRK